MSAASSTGRIPITVVTECGSTMDVAAQMFATASSAGGGAHCVAPFAVRAVAQTKGRGSNGRAWVSQLGNLHLTIILPLPSSLRPNIMPMFPCILGIALFDALNRVVVTANTAATAMPSLPCALKDTDGDVVAASSPLVLKWPNDVLVRATSAKLCGSIVESAYASTRASALCVGIGVNVVSPVIVSDGGRPGATLIDAIRTHRRGDATAPDVDAACVAEAVCDELRASLIRWSGAPEAIVPEYARRLAWDAPVHRRHADGARDPEPLRPLRLTEFGGLVARGADGRELTLTHDYLF